MNTIQSGFKYIFQEIFKKPVESKNASTFLIKAVWVMRISIFIFGFIQIFIGDALLGLMILVSVLFLIAPSFFTRSRITDIPLEIEFFLFIIVFFQFVVGEATGFYDKIPHYDKITHFFFPFLISVIGFTTAYSLYVSGKLKVSIGSMIFIVIAFTLGTGAFWEIIEYLNDLYLVPNFDLFHRAQGTNPQNALSDTMNDLLADLMGGIVGSLVASRYIIEAKYNKRLNELFKEIVLHFFEGKQKRS